MFQQKIIIPLVLAVSIIILAVGCGGNSTNSITFAQLTGEPGRYNGKTVTVEAFYFSGFEISAIAGSVAPANSGVYRLVPTGPLVWVEGGISQELQNSLYGQTDTPSGYIERIGKLKVTGKFETGKFGHLDAYQYQINITKAEKLDWSPPPG